MNLDLDTIVDILLCFYSQLDISNDEKDEREIILKKRYAVSPH